MAENSLTLSEAMQQAVELHQAGNFVQAQRLYRAIVDVAPNHFHALHLLGVLEHQWGRHESAMRLIDKALAIKPHYVEALSNRGNVLGALRRHEEALQNYDKALEISPGYVEALHNRGIALAALGRHEDALASYDKALALKPDYVDALNSRGIALGALNRREEALASYERALAIKPDYVDALSNRSNALCALKRPQEALQSFDKLLELKPDDTSAIFGRGDALRELNRHEEAVASYDRALAIKPDHVDALNNRGIALLALDRKEEALASFDKALVAKPDYAEVWANRGNALTGLKRRDEALESYNNALVIRPNYAEALYNRAILLAALNRQEEALASYDGALANKPDYAEALNNRGVTLRMLCRIDEAIKSYEKSLKLRPNPVCHSNLIFALNFDPAASTASHQAERARWHEMHAQQFASSIQPHGNDRNPDRRLRVGYVSSHFRYQAGTFAFGGVLTCHDPNALEVVCYSDTTEEDSVTARLRASSHKWRHTVGMSDLDIANLVRADEIDILVDCVGHMGGHRLLVFARKPAPIQVTAWGEPTGTGLKTMDYLFADPVLVPASERSLLAEQMFDLPNFLGYWAPDPLPEPVTLPAIANGYVTFGSFNRLAKIQEPVLRSWAAILHATPGARLIIKGDQSPGELSQRARITALFCEEGIVPDRVTLLGASDRAGHFSAYEKVDVALDPFPHGGGMTTLDALWMGLPVVTWSGRTISSRLAAASLTALGLNDFIAPDLDSYVKLAVAKANDVASLARLRGTLRGRVAGSIIGDPAQYAGAVEAAYREMWRRWCARTTSASG